jgi:hypothetical protein
VDVPGDTGYLYHQQDRDQADPVRQRCLEDVYWTDQGRKSVDAIFCVLVITGALIGGADFVAGPVGTAAWWSSVAVIAVKNRLTTPATTHEACPLPGRTGGLCHGISWAPSPSRAPMF